MLVASWSAEVLHVRGAFLHGMFEDGEQIYMGAPEGFKKHYKEGHVLLLLRTLYGLKQSAYTFWKQLLMAFKTMKQVQEKQSGSMLVLCLNGINISAVDIMGR
jgi:hypothetical protein